MSKFVVYFPQTGACRVFDSYNLAEATYPKQPIISSVDVLPSLVAKHNKQAKTDLTIHDWYESMFEFIDSTGSLEFVDGKVVKARNGSLHKRPKYHDDDPAEVLYKAFWQLATNAGNIVKVQPAAASEKKRGRPSGYRIDLVQANVVLEAVKTREIKVPLQVRQMIEFFTEQEFDYYTLAEMQKTCNSSAYYMHVKTTQDGWRIFRYYTPLMTELGVLK